ncbi:hypothetical protein LOK49_LG08G01440 [Camellia lanceoleosa]|uniref:Uncharacterized protein n=1 Tax=Camellia lanceoleosa TaxID=1840588 RepID=A0ACC0GN81_9ERIC|nr:hypothetical protein LOK49_LG08G01440 [Camellia lanceoleosa]
MSVAIRSLNNSPSLHSSAKLDLATLVCTCALLSSVSTSSIRLSLGSTPMR